MNEPFFKEIPDHSYCHKNKALETIDSKAAHANDKEETMQPVPSRIRCNTDNSVVDMDIDSEKEEKSDCKNHALNESTPLRKDSDLAIPFGNSTRNLNTGIFISPLTSGNTNAATTDSLMNSRLQPAKEDRRNVAFSTSSPDIAEQSASTSPSSDSNPDALFASQSTDVNANTDDKVKNSFKSTFTPVDFIAATTQSLPVIFDIHENRSKQMNSLKRSRSVLKSSSIYNNNNNNNNNSNNNNNINKQLYVADGNEDDGLTYSLNDNMKESRSNSNNQDSYDKKPFNGLVVLNAQLNIPS